MALLLGRCRLYIQRASFQLHRHVTGSAGENGLERIKYMETIKVRYHFIMARDKQEVFNLHIDGNTLELIGLPSENLPDWTQLDFHQCENCPLNANVHPNCPLSISLVDMVSRFENVLSYEKVTIEVFTNERQISQKTTAQNGLSAMMGLLIATSGCPHTAYFKPMARFHLPLASEEETLYRAASMYLLAQYFRKKEGKRADFELNGLNHIYNNMQLVNTGTAERLKAASETDSSTNAIIRLDLYAKIIPYFVQTSLEDIQYLFAPYLSGHDHLSLNENAAQAQC